MTYEKWLLEVKGLTRPMGWRVGQFWFFHLAQHRSGLSQRVLYKHGVDPYYLDSNLPRFFAFIKDLWDESDEYHTLVIEESLAKQAK